MLAQLQHCPTLLGSRYWRRLHTLQLGNTLGEVWIQSNFWPNIGQHFYCSRDRLSMSQHVGAVCMLCTTLLGSRVRTELFIRRYPWRFGLVSCLVRCVDVACLTIVSNYCSAAIGAFHMQPEKVLHRLYSALERMWNALYIRATIIIIIIIIVIQILLSCAFAVFRNYYSVFLRPSFYLFDMEPGVENSDVQVEIQTIQI